MATLSILLLSVNFPLALLMLAVAGRALAAELLESEVSWHRPTRP